MRSSSPAPIEAQSEACSSSSAAPIVRQILDAHANLMVQSSKFYHDINVYFKVRGIDWSQELFNFASRAHAREENAYVLAQAYFRYMNYNYADCPLTISRVEDAAAYFSNPCYGVKEYKNLTQDVRNAIGEWFPLLDCFAPNFHLFASGISQLKEMISRFEPSSETISAEIHGLLSRQAKLLQEKNGFDEEMVTCACLEATTLFAAQHPETPPTTLSVTLDDLLKWDNFFNWNTGFVSAGHDDIDETEAEVAARERPEKISKLATTLSCLPLVSLIELFKIIFADRCYNQHFSQAQTKFVFDQKANQARIQGLAPRFNMRPAPSSETLSYQALIAARRREAPTASASLDPEEASLQPQPGYKS